MRFFEIARIPQGDFGDKDTLKPMATRPKTKPLPGGSQFSYAVNKKDPEFMEIMIFDGDTLAAEMDLGATLDPLKTWKVETIAVDPDYRSQGLGKALYGIALTILKLTLEAGERLYQTQQRELVINDNANLEAWSTIADRVGAKIMESLN
jgi:GNAT superfamily N-acetyltransferase